VVCLSFTLLSGSVFATSFVTSYVAYAVIHFAAGFVHVIFHFVCVVLGKCLICIIPILLALWLGTAAPVL